MAEIEEGPPRINSDGKFCPGGWVGTYPGGIEVTPKKISKKLYTEMMGDLQGWVEMLGANMMESSLPLSANFLADSETRLAPYSRALIDYTETLIGSRLPVEVSTQQRRGYQPRGRPNFEQTLRLKGQGSQEIVSNDVDFSFDALQNHLLVRFHAELLSEMQELAAEFTYYQDAFQTQIDYHREFVTSGIPGQLLERSLEIQFSDPEVMARLRREVRGGMAEIVDLWEAYRRDIAFETDFADRLNAAIKPASKVYELWCLGQILQSLSSILGREANDSSIETEFRFGRGVKLHYNRRIPSKSRYLNPMFGVGSGEPDFALEVDRQIVWIADAKFKTFDSMQLSDYRRFLVYLIDFLSPNKQTEGTILYPMDESTPISNTIRDYTVTHLSTRPDHRDRIQTYLGGLDLQ